jgi:hypothetical protein
MKNVFGRTNEVFPDRWVTLSVPDGGFGDETPADLVAAARELNTVIDISTQPALWGSPLRGGNDLLLQKGTLQIEKATSEDHASDLVQAHLIESLSSVGREMIDFYYLRIRRNLEEYQINGAMAALEFAKQEGHIRFLGLMADGPAMAVLGFWQFHDAFETVMISRPLNSAKSFETLAPLANQRRAGIVLTDTTRVAGVPLSYLDVDLEREILAKEPSTLLLEARSVSMVAQLSVSQRAASLDLSDHATKLTDRVYANEFSEEIAGLNASWAQRFRTQMK